VPPSNSNLTVPLGGGLNGQNDYIRDLAFADAMKTAGQFRALNGGNVDFNRDAPVDARGWPTTDFAVYVNESEPPLGDYHVSFTSNQQPQVQVLDHPGSVGQVGFDAATKRYSTIVHLGPGHNAHFALRFTNTGGGAREIRVIRPGYDPADPPTFTKDYLAHLNSLKPSVLRFMDWTATNGNVISHWSDRTTPSDARQTMEVSRPVPGGTATADKGVAWEYAIELCNAVGADAWINVPVLADDGYVANLAKLFKDKLRADLRVWVEYSNELWNGAFVQTRWNSDLAQSDQALNDDGKADRFMRAQRRAAQRTVRIGDLFAKEFGSKAGPNSRVRPVLSNQYVNPFLITDQLGWIERKAGKPSDHLYAIANAPYFDTHDADKRGNLSTNDELTALSAAVDDFAKDGTLEKWVKLANDRGLRVAAYEGGPDTFGGNNVGAKKAASLDLRMRAICERYLKSWYARGGDQFNWFTLGAGSYDTQYGTWALTNDITNTNAPKIQAFQTVRQSKLADLRK
jgi:hypothetical protein